MLLLTDADSLHAQSEGAAQPQIASLFRSEKMLLEQGEKKWSHDRRRAEVNEELKIHLCR